MIELLLPALLPAAMDAVKNLAGGIARRIGGLSVEDELKIENSGIERLRALAQLDTPVGVPSQWVVDLRSSFRYIAAGVSILTGSYLGYAGMAGAVPNPEVIDFATQLISAPFAFIFGERLYFGMTGRKK